MAVNIKNTKQYRTLLASLKSEDKAMAAYRALNPEPALDPVVAQLVAGGLTVEQAEKAVAAAAEAPAPAPEPVDPTEALVEASPYTYTKGRVYVTTALIEAQARVMKTGKPEIVQSSGVGRTKAVLVSKLESGDVALQNLTTEG